MENNITKNQKELLVIIPNSILPCKTITPRSKLFYGSLLGLCNKDGYCDTDIKYLANLFNVQECIIKKWVKNLTDRGFVKSKFDQDILNKIFAKKKVFDNIGIGNKKCEWCGVKTYILNKHHHPIKKEKGGKKTINICPNCHHEFHYPVESGIKLILNKKELQRLNNLKKLL